MGFKDAFPGSYSRESIYTVNPVEENEDEECCNDCCRPNRRTKKSIIIGVLITLACLTVVVSVLLFIYFVLDDVDMMGVGRKTGTTDFDDESAITATTMKEINWNATLQYGEDSETDIKLLDSESSSSSSVTQMPVWKQGTDIVPLSSSSTDEEDYTTGSSDADASSETSVPGSSSFANRMSSTEDYSTPQMEIIETEVPTTPQLPTTTVSVRPAKNATRACGQQEFACNDDSACLPFDFVCDTVVHCRDASDEDGCTDVVCQENDFRCTDNGICIPPEWLCDSNRDCDDGSDELNCPTSECPEGQLLCFGGSCIRLDQLCDGKIDCSDGDDESGC